MTDFLILRFHRSLYSSAAVKATASRFSRLAQAEMGEEGDHLTVKLTEISEKVRPRIADEFQSHALFQTICDQRAAGGEERG